MSDSREAKPQAFVIMPFGEGFDEIYGLFIAGAVSEAGYDVIRADDIRSQQNILKDIVGGLDNSSVVIADLTSSNPNVYYELGLAHGLRKRVILLTQHVDELPFEESAATKGGEMFVVVWELDAFDAPSLTCQRIAGDG